MKRLKIYLDTSVINFIYADDAPQFQKATIEFFQNAANIGDLYISNIAIKEIYKTSDLAHRQRLLKVISENPIKLLPSDNEEEINELTKQYILRGVIPASKIDDAFHVAYATLFEMDVLLSWNFRHLANIRREARIQALNLEMGYWHTLRIISPLEALGNDT